MVHRSFLSSTKEDTGKRTNSLHHPFTYIIHKSGGILDCLIKIMKISPELSYVLIFITTQVIECDLQQDNYFAVPKSGIRSSKF